jgi:hypothetical protein
VPPPPAADAADMPSDPRYATLPPESRPRAESLRDVVARLLPYLYDFIVPGPRCAALSAVRYLMQSAPGSSSGTFGPAAGAHAAAE